jgi:hypothetical protein
MLDAGANSWEGEFVITCKHCKAEKPESEMSIWAGKPSKVCIECKPKHQVGGGARRADTNGGGGAARKKERPLRAMASMQRQISRSHFPPAVSE